MVDRLAPAHRSWLMSRVPSKNTGPEIAVRKLLHRLGYRFRLHSKKLPGKPDLVLPRLNSVVFVHGCFWHRHPGCSKASVPSTRRSFWLAKFVRNVERDAQNIRLLRAKKWRVLVIWQCETTNPAQLERRILRFLNTARVCRSRTGRLPSRRST